MLGRIAAQSVKGKAGKIASAAAAFLGSATGAGVGAALPLDSYVINALKDMNFTDMFHQAASASAAVHAVSPGLTPPSENAFSDAIQSSNAFQNAVANMVSKNPEIADIAEHIQAGEQRLSTIPINSEDYKQVEKQLKDLKDTIQEIVTGTLQDMDEEVKALRDVATANARRLWGLEKEVADLQVAVQETKEQVKANTVKTTSNASNITNNTSSITNNASSNTSNAAAIRRNEQWLEQIDKDVQGDFQHQAYEDVVKSIDAEQLQLQVFEAAEMTFEAAEMIFVGQTAAMAAHQKEWAAHQKVMQVARIKMNAATQLCAAAKQNYDLLYGES